MFKKIYSVAILVFSVIMLCACTSTNNYGNAAPEVKVERRNFIRQMYSNVASIDCTNIVDFIEDMNTRLDDKYKIQNYDMHYNDEISTVFVSSNISVLAFKVDADGNILLISCTGSQDIKAALNKGIAQTYNSEFSDSVEELFAAVEASRWLNQLNIDYMRVAAKNIEISEIELNFIAQMPDTMEMPEIEVYSGFPTITESLENKGLTSLENYFESPTLNKFLLNNSSLQTGQLTMPEFGDISIPNLLPDNTISTGNNEPDVVSSPNTQKEPELSNKFPATSSDIK